MGAELKKYLDTKRSGHPWLKDIPNHWNLCRLKFLAKINPTKSESGYEATNTEKVVFLPMESVNTDGTVDQSSRERVCDLWKGFTYFVRGDVLIAKITPCFENGKGALVSHLETEIGFGSTEFHVVRAEKKILRQFLYLISISARFRGIGEHFMIGAAGQQRVSEQFIADFPVALPPIEEQRAIVAFLDRETAKVDRLSALRQQQIDCLQEQRSAVIHHAVTQGLDPQAKMKPSGHPWLKDIPSHWEVHRLKFLAKLNPSKSLSGYKASNPEMVVFLPMECVSTDGKVDQSNRERICNLWNGFTYFSRGDVLIAKITPCFENGKGAVVSNLETDIGFGTTEFHVVRVGNNLLSKFFYLISTSSRFRDIGECFMTGAAGQQRVSEQFIADFPVAVPPIPEQQAIVAHIDRQTAKIDALIEKYRRELELLAEYRAALIAHAVSGKIDVRSLV